MQLRNMYILKAKSWLRELPLSTIAKQRDVILFRHADVTVLGEHVNARSRIWLDHNPKIFWVF